MRPEIMYEASYTQNKYTYMELYHRFIAARTHGRVRVAGETLSLRQMESARIALSVGQ